MMTVSVTITDKHVQAITMRIQVHVLTMIVETLYPKVFVALAVEVKK